MVLVYSNANNRDKKNTNPPPQKKETREICSMDSPGESKVIRSDSKFKKKKKKEGRKGNDEWLKQN